MTFTSARILLVEDETPLRVGLTDALESEGHRVLAAADGEAGLELALTENPDLVLLDLMLPKLDGFALCRELRKRGHDTPVLMLTARGLVSDRVNGLDAGADDYLVKPFSLPELHARIRALLRRLQSSGKLPETLSIGKLTVNFPTRRCHQNDREVTLPHKEFEVLKLLAEHPGQIVTRQQFLDRVWHYGAFPTTRTVDNHIARLRQKIEPDPANPVHIITLPKQGYRLNS